jgi:hypothetical protein
LGLHVRVCICIAPVHVLPNFGAYNQQMRKAGLGIFILDLRINLMIHIKAIANAVSSVLMTEAATLSLTGTITSALQIEEIFFLTDNQQMVRFFIGSDHSTPPQWDIKPFTQKFIIITAGTNSKVAKIARNLNATAHSLAHQAFRSAPAERRHVNILCSNCSHASSCPTRVALQSVTWEPRACLVSSYFFITHHIEYLDICITKYRLFMKVKTQLENNLRDKSFESN